MSLIKKSTIFFFLISGISCTINPGINQASNTPFASTNYQPRPPFNPNAPNPQINPNNPNPQTPNQPAAPAPGFQNTYYPFDLVVDTIAFMECPGRIHANNLNFFTFKFASYREGVGFNKSFLKNFPKDLYTVPNIKSTIKSSQYLQTEAKIALTEIGAPTVPYNVSGGQTNGVARFRPEFSTYGFVDSLFASPKHKLLEIAKGRKLEANFPIAAGSLSSITSSLGENLEFTLTYNKAAKDSLYPIALKEGLFYGRSYGIELEGGLYEKSYLSEIEEKNLATGKKEKSWDCPSRLRIPILRHSSITQQVYNQGVAYFKYHNISQEGSCVTDRARTGLSNSDKEFIKLILSKNAFSIGEVHLWKEGKLEGTRRPCIVPRDGNHRCYSINNLARIEFDTSKACSFETNNQGQYLKYCPTYLSVCTRRK
ncbi:MAG: hypothetical protein ACR2M7_02220 [Bdellovibrionales bacterium]